MNRRVLIAAALLLTAPAHAQWEVHDPASNAQRIIEAIRSIQQAQAQYRQFQGYYESIVHANSIGGVAAAVGGFGRTYLPSADRVGRLLSGEGSWGQAAAILQRNQAYAPTGDDWTAQEMRRRAQATANAQALASAGMEDAQQQLTMLDGLKAEIESATDPTTLNAIQAALGLVQQNIGGHQTSVAQIGQMVSAARQVDEMRDQERRRWGAEQMQATYPPLSGDLR